MYIMFFMLVVYHDGGENARSGTQIWFETANNHHKKVLFNLDYISTTGTTRKAKFEIFSKSRWMTTISVHTAPDISDHTRFQDSWYMLLSRWRSNSARSHLQISIRFFHENYSQDRSRVRQYDILQQFLIISYRSRKCPQNSW